MIKHVNPNTRSRGGFTMIETMVVLAIIVVLAGVAIPMFMTLLPNYRLKSAAQDLYSTLQSAKMTAVKTNGTETVTFDVADGKYTRSDGTVVNLNDEYKESVSYGRPDAGSDVTYAGAQVIFNARGMTDSAEGAVYFKNEKNQYIQVATQPSGIIILKKWNASTSKWE